MRLLVAVALMVGVLPIARADNELPDPSDRILRWPLSSSEHPELAPRYPVAKDLADPGLDWLELCTMGAHKRSTPNQRDQTAYLGAWCAIANRDVDTGLAALQQLMRSSVRGLPAAIRADMANVLANEGTAQRARSLLAKARIEDLVVRDRLSALFIDMNRLDDAKEMNDLALGATDRGAAACMRYARRIVLDPDNYRGAVLDHKPLLPTDPACESLELELGCWLDMSRCGAYMRATGRKRVANVFDAYARYRTQKYPEAAIVERALAGLKTFDDVRITAAALEVIAKSAGCDVTRRYNAREFVSQLRKNWAVDKNLDEKLDALNVELWNKCGP